jgi:glycosyltransferase involved in cell wall biosynthesis
MGQIRQHNNYISPLVSIGIPTFNRSNLLVRAIESAINQDYENIEIVISDNASSDETPNICLKYIETHKNIRYLRHKYNKGPTDNFKAVLESSSGIYFMWLADDDYISANYVSECVARLQKRSELSIVAGKAIFLDNNLKIGEGYLFKINQDSAMLRLGSYYWNVSDNSIFYGLFRRNLLDSGVIKKELANDWQVVASILASGKGETITTTEIYRQTGGASACILVLIKMAGLPKFYQYVPFIPILMGASRNVIKGVGAFAMHSLTNRYIMAIISGMIIIVRHGVHNSLHRVRYRLSILILGEKNYNLIKRKLRRNAR